MPSHGKMGSRELTTAPKARETGAAAREGIGPGQSAAAPSSSTSSAHLDARIPAARALPRAPSIRQLLAALRPPTDDLAEICSEIIPFSPVLPSGRSLPISLVLDISAPVPPISTAYLSFPFSLL
jgi:hypothetical protein